MSDKQRIDTLETKISKLETTLNNKADKSDAISPTQARKGVLKTDDEKTSDLATRSYVDQKTAPASVWKTIQDLDPLSASKYSIGSISMGSFISAGLGSALALTLPSFFSTSDILTKWLENKFHVVRQKNGLLWKESNQQRIDRLIKEGLPDKVKNAHRRLNYLEKTVAQLKRRSNTTRQAVRHSESSPALAGTTDRLVILETRVRLLTEALG
ncbi:hypothetical protein ACFSL4_11870 [Streptomyces caeni]|uniref:Uncharacterized protein n=1 Tax=Streptomyces caeni TaxID=2307231 RepID=A0ABW4IQR9_9ACTN